MSRNIYRNVAEPRETERVQCLKSTFNTLNFEAPLMKRGKKKLFYNINFEFGFSLCAHVKCNGNIDVSIFVCYVFHST